MENNPSHRSGYEISALKLLLLLLICSLLGGLAGAGIFALLRPEAPAAEAPLSTMKTAPQEAVSVRLDVNTSGTEVVSEIGPAVVTVINHLPARITIFGGQVQSTASGSGVIISPQGYIVTNNHVVDGAQSLTVILADGTQLDADLVGVDTYADLAVLHVSGTMPAVASWGNSDSLKA